MQWIIILLYSLYFGLLPFDNLKELSGDTINKTLGIILIIFLIIYFLLTKKKTIMVSFFNLFIIAIFSIYSLTYFFVFKNYDANYIRFCFLFILFILSSQLKIKKEWFIKICDYSSLIIAIISIASLFLNINSTYIDRTHYYIWKNMSVDANIYCSALIFPILYVFHKLINKNTMHKYLNLTMLLCMIASVLLSGSRGGIIAIGFGFLFLLFTENNVFKTNYKKVIYICMIIFGLYILIPYLPENITNRLSLSAVVKDRASDRFEIWKIAFNKFASSDFFDMIIGNGFLSFKNALNIRSVSHNLFIQTLIEGGLLMVGLFSWFYIKTIKYFKKNNNKLIVAYILSTLLMSLSLDVIISRFLWNSFIIIAMSINIYHYDSNNEGL